MGIWATGLDLSVDGRATVFVYKQKVVSGLLRYHMYLSREFLILDTLCTN